MTLPAVLVVGSHKDTELSDVVFEAGLTPVFRDTILAVTAALRRERFSAVVVADSSPRVDVLELIFNIRDMDERVRVFVLSGKDVGIPGHPLREHVSVVNLDELAHKLRPQAMAVPNDRPRNTSMDLQQAEYRKKAGK